MSITYWQKQGSEPLFPELEWNKPERRDQAGRLIIVGGSSHALGAPARAYELSRRLGIGEAKIMLPDKTKRLVGNDLPDAYFLPSTKSGELGHEAINEILQYAAWSNAVLCPGDSGRNSQTTILLEQLLRTYSAPVIMCRDAIDILSGHAKLLLERPQTIIVASFAQLQKLLQHYGHFTALTFTMDLAPLVEALHVITAEIPVAIVTLHQEQIVCASEGLVSSTKLAHWTGDIRWRLEMAAHAACFIAWNPSKVFEVLTYSAFCTAEEL